MSLDLSYDKGGLITKTEINLRLIGLFFTVNEVTTWNLPPLLLTSRLWLIPISHNSAVSSDISSCGKVSMALSASYPFSDEINSCSSSSASLVTDPSFNYGTITVFLSVMLLVPLRVLGTLYLFNKICLIKININKGSGYIFNLILIEQSSELIYIVIIKLGNTGLVRLNDFSGLPHLNKNPMSP